MPDEPAFEWDEAKSLENLRERGFDFEFATRIFDAPRIEEEDFRRNYGERRIVATGKIEDGFFLLSCIHDAARGDELFPRGRRRGKNAMTTAKRTRAEIRKRGGGRVDWARVKGTTDDDIDKMIASDADTAPDMARGRDWRRVLTPRVP